MDKYRLAASYGVKKPLLGRFFPYASGENPLAGGFFLFDVTIRQFVHRLLKCFSYSRDSLERIFFVVKDGAHPSLPFRGRDFLFKKNPNSVERKPIPGESVSIGRIHFGFQKTSLPGLMRALALWDRKTDFSTRIGAAEPNHCRLAEDES